MTAEQRGRSRHRAAAGSRLAAQCVRQYPSSASALKSYWHWVEAGHKLVPGRTAVEHTGAPALARIAAGHTAEAVAGSTAVERTALAAALHTVAGRTVMAVPARKAVQDYCSL